jgi:hypothetical protein
VIPAGSAVIWLGGQGPRGYPPARYERYRGQVPAVVVMRLTDGPVLLVKPHVCISSLFSLDTGVV